MTNKLVKLGIPDPFWQAKMTKQEYINTRVVLEHQDRASVIGLFETESGENWWVVHDGEEMPKHVYIKISEDWE